MANKQNSDPKSVEEVGRAPGKKVTISIFFAAVLIGIAGYAVYEFFIESNHSVQTNNEKKEINFFENPLQAFLQKSEKDARDLESVQKYSPLNINPRRELALKSPPLSLETAPGLVETAPKGALPLTGAVVYDVFDHPIGEVVDVVHAQSGETLAIVQVYQEEIPNFPGTKKNIPYYRFPVSTLKAFEINGEPVVYLNRDQTEWLAQNIM